MVRALNNLTARMLRFHEPSLDRTTDLDALSRSQIEREVATAYARGAGMIVVAHGISACMEEVTYGSCGES